MRLRLGLRAAGVAGVATLALASPTRAQDMESIARETTELEGQAAGLVREPLEEIGRNSPTFVEERLTNGELFYRLRDYVRASIIFTDIVDNFPRHPAYSDALFLLADSLYQAGDRLGARTRFREIVDHANDPRFRTYVQRALGRLLEIAIHTREFDDVEELFARLGQSGAQSDSEGSIAYFRSKLLYNRAVPADDVLRRPSGTTPLPAPHIDAGLLEQARNGFEAVPETSPYRPQALYYIGVIHTLREQFPQAIDAFTRVLRADATTTEHQAVAELAQLALGRLYYETEQLDQAIEAYQSVPRTSANFDVALYEIAWVYIHLGDSTRAERALEVLSLAAPDSRLIPDGKLLRANLLLRNGRLADAQTVFREVATEFGPVRAELDAMLRAHDDDPLGFFRGLVRENMEHFDAQAFLPPLAQRWATLEGDMDRALSALGGLAQARQLAQETNELAQRLTVALRQPNRVALFGDLRHQRERATQLWNRVTRLRQQLITIESRNAGPGSGELEQVRQQRRELEHLVDRMPRDEADIAALDAEVLRPYDEMSRDLSRCEVMLFGNEAQITAMRLYVDSPNRPAPDPAARAALLNELDQQTAAVAEWREEIRQIRVMIEAARLGVGVGDDRYRRQDQVRAQYEQLVARERQLGGRSDANADALYRRLAEVEATIEGRDAQLDRVANERASDMSRAVEEETARVQGYQQALAALETDAEDVVGAVTYQNFRQVQRRFYDLVLRADVGRVDVAWAEREEHRTRVEMLTRERAREIQALEDEFREIMDENTGTNGAQGATE